MMLHGTLGELLQHTAGSAATKPVVHVLYLEDGVGVVGADDSQHLQLLSRLRPQRLQNKQ
jgi:hypothetical protein